MDSEDRELLKRVAAISEENHDMLRSMQRSMRLGRFMSILYWVFIIGSTVGAYYLIQPYLEQVMGFSADAKAGINNYQGIIDNFKQYTQ